MKGSVYQFHPHEVPAGGISPRLLRLTDEQYTCNHLYFHNRSFTPDDQRVVFESTLDGGNNLFIMELATGKVTQLTEGRSLDYFAYISRDGSRVFFGADGCIRSVDLATLEERVEVDAQALVTEKVTKCSGAFPSWDGKKLVCFYEAAPDYGLIVKDLVSGECRVILHGPQHVRHCQFCPQDSNLILYAHEGNWEAMRARMWLVQADGANNRRVRDHDDGDYEAAGHEFWGNTARRLYFTIRREGRVFFACYDVDEDREQTLFELDNEHGTITMDDRYIICDSKRGQGEMYMVRLADNRVEVLCRQNMSWRPDRSMYHPHVTVSYRTNKAIFTTDGFGNPGVFLADIPEF